MDIKESAGGDGAIKPQNRTRYFLMESFAPPDPSDWSRQRQESLPLHGGLSSNVRKA